MTEVPHVVVLWSNNEQHLSQNGVSQQKLIDEGSEISVLRQKRLHGIVMQDLLS